MIWYFFKFSRTIWKKNKIFRRKPQTYLVLNRAISGIILLIKDAVLTLVLDQNLNSSDAAFNWLKKMSQGTAYPANVVIVQPKPLLGNCSTQVTCGNCNQTVLTTTVPTNGACSYITALVIALICCPLFWIPLCIDSCNDVQHLCPACGAYLGTYKRL